MSYRLDSFGSFANLLYGKIDSCSSEENSGLKGPYGITESALGETSRRRSLVRAGQLPQFVALERQLTLTPHRFRYRSQFSQRGPC